MNKMTPEEYGDFLEAAEIHNVQDLLDGVFCAEFGMSPVGLKDPKKFSSSREKTKQHLQNRRIVGLGTETLKAPVQKINAARASLKQMFQGEVSKGKGKLNGV